MSSTSDATPFRALGAHRDLIHSVAFDHHGRRLATCSSDKTVSVWDRAADGSWKKSAIWKVHGGAVWRAVWAHPEFGQILVTCSYDRHITVWEEQFRKSGLDETDPLRGKYQNQKTHWIRRQIITDSRSDVTDVAFAPRHLGLLIASCTAQGTIRIYEVADLMDVGKWSLVHELQAFHTRCGCIAWSQSRMHRPLIAVGSDEKRSESTERIVVYENIDGLRKWQRIVAVKLDLPAPVTDLCFSPISMIDWHQLAIAAGDVHLYSIKVSKASIIEDETGEAIGEPPVTNTEYSVHKIAHLGDLRKAWRVKYNVMGTVITATSFDGTVRSWKSLFVNQWVKMAEMAAEDYMNKTVDNSSKEKSNEKTLVYY